MSKESDRKEINRILHRMVASPFRAILGDGGGTVNVAGKTGWAWARKLGQEGTVFQAYNREIVNPNEGRVVLVQESRIEGLPGYEIIGSAGGDISAASEAAEIVICDKDKDSDLDPYISTSWDGGSFSNGATGTINWVNAFSLPEIPRLVSLFVTVRDSASAGNYYYIRFRAKSTTTTYSLIAAAESAANDQLRGTAGPVAVAGDGTTYYSVVASGVNTMDVWVYVVTYVK